MVVAGESAAGGAGVKRGVVAVPKTGMASCLV